MFRGCLTGRPYPRDTRETQLSPSVLTVAAPEILFRRVIKKLKLKKKFNKKRIWIYQVIDKKLIIKHEVLQFLFTSFQILNYYVIIHYECLLLMWVALRAYDHFILLSLPNIFIFMQLLLSICLCFYKNILK